jgi:hypothetical protein
MEVHKLDDMTKGWFIGNFTPTLHCTNDVEVAVKHYLEGEHEASHHHKIATEYTAIVKGSVLMNGQLFSEGDIIKILPNESTDFKALTDATTVVVKIPGASNDKYID